MRFNFTERLKKNLEQEYSIQLPEMPLELCPANFTGDITISCFALAKAARRNPMQLAERVKELLAEDEDVEAVEVVKAFVNVTIKAAALMRDTVAESNAILEQVKLPEDERRKILIEFSAPNTNKPQHLGHVRNNAIGMATASILELAQCGKSQPSQ